MDNKNRFDINRYLQTSKQKSYFVVLVTIALVILVAIVGILPAYSAILFQIRENQKRDEGVAQLNQVVEQYKNFLRLEEELNVEIDQFNSVFPVDISPQENVIEEITQMAQSANLEVSSVSFSDTSRDISLQIEFLVGALVSYQSVSISLDGSRESILEFIQELETSKRIYNIVNTRINRKDQLDQSSIVEGRDYSATIQAEFYWTQNTVE